MHPQALLCGYSLSGTLSPGLALKKRLQSVDTIGHPPRRVSTVLLKIPTIRSAGSMLAKMPGSGRNLTKWIGNSWLEVNFLLHHSAMKGAASKLVLTVLLISWTQGGDTAFEQF
jgi:hypothetical protein